jgi:hypothetical protein
MGFEVSPQRVCHKLIEIGGPSGPDELPGLLDQFSGNSA